MLRFPLRRPVWAVCLVSLCAGAYGADDFEPAGARARLSVEYIYESTGKTQDKYDSHEWRVKRVANLTAELSAQAVSPLPALQELDAGQQADIQGKTAKGQAVAVEMAPMMASIESIMAKCGDDDACIEAAATQLGFGMSDTPELARMQEVQKDVEDISRQGAPRYQVLQSQSQSGTYLIEEAATKVYAEMGMGGCENLPGRRCTRNETRQGGGALTIPDATGLPGAVERDAEKNTLTIVLPRPIHPLAYTEVAKSDDPDPSRAGGTKDGLHSFRVSAKGEPQPFTVAVNGDWRRQSGEQVLDLPGNAGEGGKLTIRWRLEPM